MKLPRLYHIEFEQNDKPLSPARKMGMLFNWFLVQRDENAIFWKFRRIKRILYGYRYTFSLFFLF